MVDRLRSPSSSSLVAIFQYRPNSSIQGLRGSSSGPRRCQEETQAWTLCCLTIFFLLPSLPSSVSAELQPQPRRVDLVAEHVYLIRSGVAATKWQLRGPANRKAGSRNLSYTCCCCSQPPIMLEVHVLVFLGMKFLSLYYIEDKILRHFRNK